MIGGLGIVLGLILWLIFGKGRAGFWVAAAAFVVHILYHAARA
jgi:hypothetical protein